jgi:prevent-host-death family protein
MDMLTVSAAEFQRNFGRYQDEALKQPLSISRNGRERLVVLAVEEYASAAGTGRCWGLPTSRPTTLRH